MSQKNTEDLIRQAFETGDFTGWFEAVYASAAEGTMKIPWAQMQPAPGLVQWASEARPQAAGRTALVVGCGLGDDAEFLAGLGYAVTAFDVSPSAIAGAQARFPQSSVRYQVADLLNLPVEWRHSFDFVLEHRTIQALPWHFCQPAIEAIGAQVRQGGQVLVIAHGREPEEDRRGIPWRLSRAELAHFLAQGLREVRFDDGHDSNGRREFRVLYQRDDDGQYIVRGEMNLEAVKEVIDRLSAEELHQLQQYIAQRSAALSTVQSLSTLSTEERIRRLDAAAQAVRQGFSESQWAELEEAMNEEL